METQCLWLKKKIITVRINDILDTSGEKKFDDTEDKTIKDIQDKTHKEVF